MSLVELIKFLPKPTLPVETDKINWRGIEEEIGLILPDDYKDFVSNYGTGVIGDFLWVLNPFSENPSLNFECMRYFQESYKQIQSDYPKSYFRKPFPEIGSFITWATTENGDSLFWSIENEDPNLWPVGVQASDPAEEEVLADSMTELLVFLTKRNLESQILPRDFIIKEKTFAPYKP